MSSNENSPALSPIKQFFVVYEYELKQAFLTTKAIITLSSLTLLTSTLIYWLYRLQSKFYSTMDADEQKVSKLFNRIFSNKFYESFPFFENADIYIIFLQLCSLTFIPAFIYILSYDITSNEIRDKTFRYFIFRCHPLTLCIGKYFAYVTQFAIIHAMLWSLALAYNYTRNPNMNFGLDASYIFHFWIIDQFLNAFVISLNLGVSCIFRNPLLASLSLLFFMAYLFMKLDQLNQFGYDIFYGMVSDPTSPNLQFSLISLAVMTTIAFSIALWVMYKKEL